MDKPRPNKHAAKAKRHIYSSGAAGTGGKAEPTNAKNAGQPIECPLCDRIFKQDGRLKEHVKNKHADGINQKTGADAAPPDDSATTPESTTEPEAATAAQPKYFVKTPKTMLTEWCQKQKRPMPKYKAVEAEGGVFRCRVVIPDPKDSEKDILLWWNEGAPTPEAAQQGAAVAGLHAVAGERRMDRILPEEFRDQWRNLDERAAQQKEREKKQAERKAAAAKRPPPPRRTLQSVFMSEDNRQLVEGLIRDSQSDADTWQQPDDVSSTENIQSRSGDAGPSGHATFTSDFAAARPAGSADVSVQDADASDPVPDVSRKLLAMGFAESDVAGATRAYGHRSGVNRLVDWLVLNVPESRLPKQFRPEASGAHVEVVRKGLGFRTTGSGAEAVSDSCREVMERGFARMEAEGALESTDGNVIAALCFLSGGIGREILGPTGGGVEGSASCSDEDLAEERMALEAIYADDFSEILAEGGALISGVTVRLPPQEEGEERTKIEFRFPGSSCYPQEPPCISFRNRNAPPVRLKRLTALGYKRAGGLVGEPMLWALVEGAIEDLGTLELGGLVDSSALTLHENGPAPGEVNPLSVASASETAGITKPGAAEVPGRGAQVSGGGQRNQRPAPPRKENGFANPAAVQKESVRLREHWQRWLREGRYANMRQTRELLPAAKQRAQLLEAIEGPNAPRVRPRVTIVCGQTGCGKSTQVPQYLLERWTESNRGGECNVIVTQPRRVAAIGLAERVAAERGEKVGETVGYSVRLESKRSVRTRLLFCTTGVLLRRMQSDRGLEGLTHVVVDEVHERTVEGDLMLLLLRTLISEVRKDLTVVLMSATANADELAAYFGSDGSERSMAGSDGQQGTRTNAVVNVISIPGFTHPVRELYLEDVLELTGEVIGVRSRYAKKKAPGRSTGAEDANQRKGASGRENPVDGATPPVEKSAGAIEAPGASSRTGNGAVKDDWELDKGEDENEDTGQNETGTAEAQTAKLESLLEPDSSRGGFRRELKPTEGMFEGQGRGGWNPGTGVAKQGGRSEQGSEGGSKIGPEKERDGGGPARQYREATLRSMEVVDEEMLNYELVEKLLRKVLEEEQRPSTSYSPLLPPLPPGTPDAIGAAGAILVFLPGMAEIRRLERQLSASQRLAQACGGSPWVLPLHGSLAGEQQRRVFDRPPPGRRKIVLSTNVAETSLTIDDVTYVVDTGRQREMVFDPNRALACLEDVWVSQASAQQRRGRAGRARPGCCIRLFSRRTFSGMATQQAPEVLRTSLDQLCLQVKSLLPDPPIASVLSSLLTPPSPAAINASLSTLISLRALALNPETLTPLGRHLARMPVDVRVGKMLVMGAVLGCPGPATTIAAVLSGKSPFAAVPPDVREEADRVKARLAGNWKSDHLAAVAAFDGWKRAGREGGWRGQQEYCQSHFLSRDALQSVEASRTDYLDNLADLGFIPRGFARDHLPTGAPDPDVNALNFRVVKAVLCAGFYPNVVRVQLPEQTYKETSSGAMAKDAKAREVRFFTRHDGRVFLHPASVNFAVGRFESPWLVYSEKVKTSKIFIRESSMVPAYALLLFGGEITVAHEKQCIAIDDWMRFEAPAKIAVLVRELRNRLDQVLADKIENPGLDVTSLGVVTAVVKLLTNDGF